MTSSHEQIKKDHNINSPATQKLIVDHCTRLAEIDAQRAELNDEAAKMRETLKNAGLVPAAVQSKYTQFKKLRKQKEEYTQTENIAFEALNAADTADMFKDLDARDARIAEEKAKKEAEKPKAKKNSEREATAEELKNTIGGKKSVGEQQAEHLQKTIGGDKKVN